MDGRAGSRKAIEWETYHLGEPLQGCCSQGGNLPMLRADAMHLYRHWLRTANSFPLPAVREKIKFNIREVVEIYKRGQAGDENLFSKSKEASETVRRLSKLEGGLFLRIFHPFSKHSQASQLEEENKSL